MSIDRQALTAAFDTIDAAFDDLVTHGCDALATREQFAFLQRCEKVRRRLPAVEHPLINNLLRQATAEEIGGKLSHAIAEMTLITRSEASRRIREATDLGPRRALSGEPLAPTLVVTAAQQRQGTLGPGQVAVIRNFYHQLPGWIDAATREQTEANWPLKALGFGPNNLPNWPPPWPIASTLTATSPMKTERGAAELP